jgi:hypothetical protein
MVAEQTYEYRKVERNNAAYDVEFARKKNFNPENILESLVAAHQPRWH